MEVFQNLLLALRFDERAYWHLREKRKTVSAGSYIIAMVGLAYGLSNYFLFRETLVGMMSSKSSMMTGAMVIVVSGISITFLAHGGIVLLVWAISKGFRGPGHFPLLYGNLGIAMAPLIVAAPLASYIWLTDANMFNYILAAPFVAWFWALVIQALRAAEGHSYIKATGVLLTTMVFIVSLLYLWVLP